MCVCARARMCVRARACACLPRPVFQHIYSSPVWMSVCKILHRYIPKSVFLYIYYFRELVHFGSPDKTITTAVILIPFTCK